MKTLFDAAGIALDDPAARRATLPRKARMLIDTAATMVEEPPTIATACFLDTVLCQVGMPRRHLSVRRFERCNGGASLLLEAGALWNGAQWIDQPLPYGPKPRLMMIHVCTEAVRHKTRTVSLGRSLRQFMAGLGFPGEGRAYDSIKTQIKALAACRMTLGATYRGRATTVDAKPFRRFEAWMAAEHGQDALWPAEIELSEDFYASLREGSVPLPREAIAALKGSSLALDAYTWLAHRLWRVNRREGEKVFWTNLRAQFGQDYDDPKNFQRKFRTALRQALTVYPGARIDEDTIGGIILLPSPPPVPKLLLPGKMP